VLFTLQLNRKIWMVRLLTHHLWAEVAAWSTARSTLKGWRVERTKCGVRVVTPLIGAAIAVGIGENRAR
jgi:hypothetical protein